MGKGPDWERETCKMLSQWWSKNGDDDLFWRTHGSGARATSRHKVGKRTRGQYGDVAAVDHRGATFTRMFTVSLKRGYSRSSVQELIDASETVSVDGQIPEQAYSGWIREVMDSAIQSKSTYWMIIIRRDKRKPVVMVPGYIFLDLDWNARKEMNAVTPQISGIAWVKQFPNLTQKQKDKLKQELGKKKYKKAIKKYNKRNNNRRQVHIRIYPLHEFLDIVDRSVIVKWFKSEKAANPWWAKELENDYKKAQKRRRKKRAKQRNDRHTNRDSNSRSSKVRSRKKRHKHAKSR